MAEIKKYLDTTALSTLVDQIKAEDAKGLQAAKDYADGLAKNYDAAGTAQTKADAALASAKEYTDALANGQVATNKTNVEAIMADYLKADDKEALQSGIDGVDDKADKNAEDIAAINNGETGILAQAKKYADDEDAKVEELVAGVSEDVADLTAYVGTIPEGATATNVVAYVQEKTAGIATDAALGELQAAVDEVEADVAEIMEDYLKAADKTELEGKVTAEETRATEAEAGLAARIKAVEDDYLVEADKTELQGKIDEKAAQTALDAEIERATGVEEGLQNQINLIMNNPDTKDVIDSIAEFTVYVEEHGEIADGFRTDINKNKEDIAAEVKRAGEAEAELVGRLDVLEAVDHEAYVAADTALKNELNGEIAKKADTTALEAAVEALEGADAGQVERIAALEAKFTGEGSVADIVADAKQEAIDTAAQDATDKADKALADAKDYADGLDEAMSARVEALEAIDHSHANQAELDLIASGDKAKWDAAAAKAHEHANAAELAKVADGDVAKWNAAEGNAKTYADGLNTAMTTKVDGVDTRVKTLEETIVDKAEQDDLDAAVARIAANETAIVANTSAINSFTAITPAEVEALFA